MESQSNSSETLILNNGIEELEVPSKNTKLLTLDCLKEKDEAKLFEFLNEFSEEDLSPFLNEVNKAISNLKEENYIYEFTMKDQTVQNTLEMLDVDSQSSSAEGVNIFLSYPAKCYFANKCLIQLKKILEQEKFTCSSNEQDMRFQLESLNTSLKNLKEEKENFDKSVRLGGRHAVTKQVILQKVAKFFEDSIKNKMAMTNRCKIQIQSDMMERNKLISQIKEQEKRLASLDLLKYQEAKFQYENSCKSLQQCKNQLSKCKSKYSSISHNVVEIKKSLVKEQMGMKHIQVAVSKKENMKNVIITEKARNDQKMKELNAAMRKIKLDPRRHDLPEVVDYATVKKENVALKRSIKHWKQKVTIAEQAKLMYLSAEVIV